MVALVSTVAYLGLEARAVEVQVQLTSGVPRFVIVGLADKAVGESRERVRATRYISIGEAGTTSLAQATEYRETIPTGEGDKTKTYALEGMAVHEALCAALLAVTLSVGVYAIQKTREASALSAATFNEMLEVGGHVHAAETRFAAGYAAFTAAGREAEPATLRQRLLGAAEREGRTVGEFAGDLLGFLERVRRGDGGAADRDHRQPRAAGLTLSRLAPRPRHAIHSPMTDPRLILAVGRIERALTRIEARAPGRGDDTLGALEQRYALLEERHEHLRARTTAAIDRLSELIEKPPR